MSNESDAQRLAAALEQLEIERLRRADERVASGEAIRVPAPVAVAREGEDIDTAIQRLRARKIEELRAAGEKREIVFEESDISVIWTGVPRHGEFGKWKHELFEAFPDRYAMTTTTPPRKEAPAPSEPASLQWESIQTQFSPPDERSCGIIIEGARAVAGNQLHVRDHAGQTWVIPLNGDPDVQARRLLREKYGKNHAFNAPIHYPPRSYH
jgi:hypothetical protein